MDCRLPWEPQYIDASGFAASGQSLACRLKALVYDDGAVFFELRGPIDSFMSSRNDLVKLVRWFKQHAEPFATMLGTMGTTLECEVRPSMQAALAWGGQRANDEYVRQEWTVTTTGLVVLFVMWATTRHARGDQERAMAMLAQVFSIILQQEDLPSITRSTLEITTRDTGAQCNRWYGGDMDSCRHISVAKNALAAGGPRSFVLGLIQLARDADTCEAARQVVADVLNSIVEALDQRLRQCPFPSDAHTALACRGGLSKRRRVDEDIKVQGSGMLIRRQTTSVAQFLQNSGHVSGKTSAMWEGEFLKTYAATMKLGLDVSGVCNVTEDAARAGRPAEDCIAYMYWEASSNRSAYLPFQAEHTFHD